MVGMEAAVGEMSRGTEGEAQKLGTRDGRPQERFSSHFLDRSGGTCSGGGCSCPCRSRGSLPFVSILFTSSASVLHDYLARSIVYLMKHKRESSLDGGGVAQASDLSAEQIRELFSKLNPHVPLQAYDDLLLQYTPSPLVPIDDSHKVRSISPPMEAFEWSHFCPRSKPLVVNLRWLSLSLFRMRLT